MCARFLAGTVVMAWMLTVFAGGVSAVDVKVRWASNPPWENITFPVIHYLVAYEEGSSPVADSAGDEKSILPKESLSPVYVGYVVIYADGFFHAKFIGLETRKDIQALFEPYEEPLQISYYLCGLGVRGVMNGRWEEIQLAVSRLDDMRVRILYTTDGVWPFPDWGPVFIQYCREYILQFLRDSFH